MTVQKSLTTLSDLQDPLTEAIRRLIEKDGDRHPFVIVEPIPKIGVFVQFSGARDQPLLYDCPPLGVFNDRCLLNFAVERGIEGLKTQGVEPKEQLQIIESEDRAPWRIRDLFRRLVGASLVMVCCGCRPVPDPPDVARARAEEQRAIAAAQKSADEVRRLNDEANNLRGQCSELRSNEAVLKALKDGKRVHYIFRVSIRQVSYSFSIRKQLRDAVNEEQFEMPTDKVTYEHTSEGADLFDSFRAGSALFHGSLGSWRLKVVSKRTEVDDS